MSYLKFLETWQIWRDEVREVKYIEKILKNSSRVIDLSSFENTDDMIIACHDLDKPVVRMCGSLRYAGPAFWELVKRRVFRKAACVMIEDRDCHKLLGNYVGKKLDWVMERDLGRDIDPHVLCNDLESCGFETGLFYPWPILPNFILIGVRPELARGLQV